MLRVRRRYLLLAGAAAAAGWLAIVVLRQPVEVDAATVARGPLVVTVDEDARTRVTDRFVVSAPVAGQLERLPVRAGDAVAVGDVLATIRPPQPAPLDARTAAQLRAA